MSLDAGEAYAAMMVIDGADLEIVMERKTVDPGVSFSAEAMDDLGTQLMVWVGTRVMRRWQATGEPPTALVVRIHAEAQ